MCKGLFPNLKMGEDDLVKTIHTLEKKNGLSKPVLGEVSGPLRLSGCGGGGRVTSGDEMDRTERQVERETERKRSRPLGIPWLPAP